MSRGKVMGVLVAVLCVPAATIAWLAFNLIGQDHALESQRLADTREQAVTEAAVRLNSMLSRPELLRTAPSEGALLAHFPGTRLLFHSTSAPDIDSSFEVLQQVELHEFRNGGLATATEEYRKLSRTAQPSLRAGALLRLGRALRKAGHTQQALETFDALARMETAVVDGWPAPVAAVWSRCVTFEFAGQRHALQREALRLSDMLLGGSYALSRASYTTFVDDVVRWAGVRRPFEREWLTDAVLAVEAGVRQGVSPPSGRVLVSIQKTPITVIWGQTGGSLAVLAALPRYVEQEWLSKVGSGVWLADDGGYVFGTARGEQAAVRYGIHTGLPWKVLASPPSRGDDFAARRRVLVILLMVVALFTIAGSYVVLGALRREFALARMQQDFVAAVSHEFRTPLTTLRQIAEVLEEGRVNSHDRRATYYRSLSRATHRLHRLVEDLLDFRRMQSGAFEYRKTLLNAAELSQQVAADFQREVEDRGFQVVASAGPAVYLLGDAEAIGRALWNLLDNAVKYSGDARRVELDVGLRDGAVIWSVRDHGIGIPEHECSLVFHKFYRGRHAREAGIRGTGIGLAMVEQIVAAHGGKVSVSAKSGAGSVFTMSIPRAGAEWPGS